LAIFHANAGGFTNGARRTGFGPFEQRRPGFTLPRHPKGQTTGFSAAWPIRGLHVQASCQRSGLRRSALRLIRPLLTSTLRSGCLSAFSVAEATQSRSPGVSSVAFRAQSPDLRFASLMDMDFAVSGPLVRRSRLVPGSCPSTHTFALRFLQTSPRGDSPCVVANPSPPSGWVEDFHLQATEHAQHTTKSLRDSSPAEAVQLVCEHGGRG
jgi:hypothetical protein